ncbi:MAG: HAD family hydrolase [Candidatus Liptonbacteria bacterium]|nr:HAD family hydrolase [Candidatus Liptonbacteria bacterium]
MSYRIKTKEIVTSAPINKNRWCLLDRDGVLVKDRGHTHKISDLEILPNVTEGLRLLKDAGFRFIVVTNQAGIAKKYYTREDADLFNCELQKRLAKENIFIEAFYVCPHHPHHTGECFCRKPNTGMLEQAQKKFFIKPALSILVGDKDSDIEAGKRWGCKTFRIASGQYPAEIKADYNIKNLLEVANILNR